MSDTPEEAKALQEIRSVVAFGLDVQAFIQSTLGRYLINKAEQEIEAAVDKLKIVSPVLIEEVRALQNDIKRAESFQFWLAEAIQEGQSAEKTFQEYQD